MLHQDFARPLQAQRSRRPEDRSEGRLEVMGDRGQERRAQTSGPCQALPHWADDYQLASAGAQAPVLSALASLRTLKREIERGPETSPRGNGVFPALTQINALNAKRQ